MEVSPEWMIYPAQDASGQIITPYEQGTALLDFLNSARETTIKND